MQPFCVDSETMHEANNLITLLSALLCISINCVCGAKILAVCPWPGRSHFVFKEPLLLELAKRGHQVTVLSHFPQDTKTPNYTDISLVGSRIILDNSLSLVSAPHSLHILRVLPQLLIDLTQMESVMKSESMMQLINSTETFDLVITELFINDVSAAFAKKFKVPLIAMTSMVPLPWSNYRVANPDNPAYIPNFFSSYSTHMCFKERLTNTIIYILTKIAYIYYLNESEIIVKKHFGNDFPPLEEILKDTSLLLLNSFPVLNGARPTVPQVIEIGGIHVKPAKTLSQVNYYLSKI